LSHYNDDDTGIGFELKKIQMEYQHYDGMGVPITWEIFKQSRKPSDYDDYPYLYEETTEEDYRFALAVEERKCVYLILKLQHSKTTDRITQMKKRYQANLDLMILMMQTMQTFFQHQNELNFFHLNHPKL
jgi:hypothetical protein